jgi:hypothetical protein
VILFNGGNNPAEFYADAAQLVAGGGGAGGSQGGSAAQSVEQHLALITGTPDGIELGINNSEHRWASAGPPTTSPDFANGSELDNMYAKIDNGRLYVFLGGNLESNYNNLESCSSTPTHQTANGGQNELRSDNVDIDFNKPQPHGHRRQCNAPAPIRTTACASRATDFYASAFVPDYWLRFGTNGNEMYMNAAVLRTPTAPTASSAACWTEP